MWRKISFRGKLVAAGIVVQVAAIALITWNSAHLIDSYLHSELRARAEQDAPLFNAAFAAPMMQRDYATVQAIIRESRVKQGVSYIIVCDAAGRAVGQDGWPENAPKPDSSLPQPVRTADGGLRYDFKASLILEGQKLGILHYGLSGAFIAEVRDRLLLRTLLVGLAVLVVFSLLLAVLAHLLTRPLKRLTDASRQIRAGDYDVKLDAGSSDEIGVLTEDFRHMAAEVKRRVGELTASEALQRRTLADLQIEHVALEAARGEADAANKAKSDFLAKMSHEIRTPMHGILGMIDLLKDSPLDSKQQERVAVVQRSGEALLEVVNDVLDFSKIQYGKLELEAVAFSPGDIAMDTVHLFMPRASAKGVSINAEIAADFPRTVRGDPTRLRQILGNLVGNAVKFTERGAITLRLSQPHAERLLIEVQDSGIGISRAAIARIFEPFSQADDSTTRRYGGTGLGLAISSQIVKLMGGVLTVESTLGAGSTFRAELTAPVVASAVAAAPAVPLAAGTAQRSFDARVLLAEDNRVNQLLAESMLTKIGCKTRIAANGTDAVALFAEGGFDIVLMDCHMPEMDGYQATAAIRALEANKRIAGGARIPIIAVTANVMEGERDRCIAAGMDDYMSKPFGLRDIAAVMEKWANAKRA